MTSPFGGRWATTPASAVAVRADGDSSFISPRGVAPVTSSTSQMPSRGLGTSGSSGSCRGAFGGWTLALPQAPSGTGGAAQPSGAGPVMGSHSRTWQDFERVMDTADTQQQHLFHVQWGLIKEQMTSFARDTEVLVAEIGAVRSEGVKVEASLRQHFNGVLQSIEIQVGGRLDSLEGSHHEHVGIFRDGLAGLEGQLRAHHEHIQGLGGLDSRLRQHIEDQLRAHGEAFDSRLRGHAEEHSGRLREGLTALEATFRGHHDDHTSHLRDALAGLEGEMRSCYDEHSNRLRDGLAGLEGQVRSHHDDLRSQFEEHKHENETHHQAWRAGLDSEKRERDAMHTLVHKRCGEHESLVERRFTEHQNLLAQERIAREQHHGKFEDFSANERQSREGQFKVMQGMIESLEQRMSGSHSALQDRLQKHADEHRNGLQAALAEADVKMRAEVARGNTPLQELDQRIREEMSRMSAGHQGGLDQLRSELGNHKAVLDQQHGQTAGEHRRALEEMDRQVRQQMAGLAEDHSSSHSKALGALANLDQELRKEMKDQLCAQQDAVAQQQAQHASNHGDLKFALAEADRATREEMGKLKADHADKCGSLEQMLSNHNSKLDGHMAETTATHDGHRNGMKALDDKMRAEMARLSSEHSNSLEGHSAALEQSAAEHKKQLEELDRQVREQIAQLANDHSSKHAAANEALANLDVQLRREISRTNSLGVEGRVEEKLNEHRNQHKALAARHVEHQQTMQSALDALEKQLRGDVAKLGSDHLALHGALTGHVGDQGRDMDRKLAAHRISLDDRYVGLQGAIDTVDAGLKKELGRIVGEHGDNHRQLRDTFDAHRAGLSRQQEAERAERDQNHESFQSTMKESERQVRKELAAFSAEHQTNHSKLQSQLAGHGKDHKAALQAATEEMDGQIKREVARLAVEQNTGYSKFSGMLDEHKSSLEKALHGERAARDELGGGHRRALEELERNLRRELEKTGAEHASGHQTLRDSLGEHRRDVEKVLAGERATRDEHRNSMLEQLDQLEQQLRREMAQASDAQGGGQAELRRLMETQKGEVRSHVQTASEEISADLRKALALLTEEHSGKHQALQRSVEQVDRALRGELSSHKSDFQVAQQKTLNDNSEGLRGTAQANHQKLLQSVQEHKQNLDKNITQHKESIREYLQQEKMERSRHHTTVSERIQSLEGAIADTDDLRARLRDAEETPNGISRGEFDSEMHRIWQAMDSHTHGIAQPEVIEERIIIEERVAPPPTTVVVEEPVIFPQPPRLSMFARPDLSFGQPISVVSRAQSQPTVVPSSSFIGMSPAQVTRIR